LGERDVDAIFRFFDLFNITCSVNAYRFPGTGFYLFTLDLKKKSMAHTFCHERCKMFNFHPDFRHFTVVGAMNNISPKVAERQEIAHNSRANRSRNDAANVAVACV
jgi:hypothetical protein